MGARSLMPFGPPQLSVIVPARNEKHFIRGCIESILSDAPAGGIEVIVVDGLSDDGTTSIVREIASTEPRVRLLDNPSRFVPQAMNLGIQAAAGEFIGRVDGHCLVERGYFPAAIRKLLEVRCDCAGGVLVNEGRTPTGRSIAAATSSPIGVGSARFRTGHDQEVLVDTLAFGVYRKDVFHRIGLFDERFVRNQDDELNFRLVLAGGRILLLPSVRIRYFVRDSLRLLWRQYFQYGYWKWRVFRKHGRFASWRQLAPSTLVLSIALLAVASLAGRAGQIALAASLFLYLMAVGLAGAWLARRGRAPWMHTAAAIVTLHISYGIGLLVAALRALTDTGWSRIRPGPTKMSR